MDILTDELLMLSFRNNRDIKLYSELIERYARPALAIARSYVFDKETAEDALQEAFIRIMNKCESFRADQPFAPWFYRILRNICIDLIRKRKIGNLLALRLSGEPENPFYEQAETSGSPYIALVKKLPVKEREVVMLKVAKDMTFEEIAKTIGCSVEAAKKRSQRGIERLREIAKSESLNMQLTGTWN